MNFEEFTKFRTVCARICGVHAKTGIVGVLHRVVVYLDLSPKIPLCPLIPVSGKLF